MAPPRIIDMLDLEAFKRLTVNDKLTLFWDIVFEHDRECSGCTTPLGMCLHSIADYEKSAIAETLERLIDEASRLDLEPQQQLESPAKRPRLQ
jgi:hypothetical protein